MCSALAFVLLGGCATSPEPEAGDAAEADDFLIVDCLLPGAVRQLGTKAVYVSPRRPVRTSAIDCAVRGGEYTVSDRADPAMAVSVWLPPAQEGDPEAQNYLGEIYERGIGLRPDYEAAALWYRRAAEQGHGPAQVNLGQLLERGLGVERDPDEARVWYRRASGLEAAGVAYLPSAPGVEVEALRRQLVQAEDEIASLRGKLASSELARNDRDDFELQLAEARASLERSRAELAAVRAAEADLGRAREDLEQARRAYALLESKNAELERALEQRSASEAELDALRREVERLEGELEETYEAPDLASLPGPNIRIIEPVVDAGTRGVQVVAVEAIGAQRLLIGQVVAAAGLLRVLVDGHPQDVSPEGLFEAELVPEEEPRQVRIVAVDRIGRRTERELLVSPVRPEASAPREQAGSELDFGRYHALVIGNDAYRHLPDLETARKDARAIATLLEQRFGFEVRLVEDATRYEILSSLNTMREELTSEDNLLLYYAGHGHLDEVNQRGHWLPVDAERDSNANWISNVAITDILNAMSARHVIVISDSCYSGSLTRSALARLESGLTDEELLAWRKAMLEKRSRTALTSGGLAPVLDYGGGEHSVFARALIDVLGATDEIVEGQQLYQAMAARVTYLAEQYRFEQLPQYAPIKFSGHEAGDFFFVPSGLEQPGPAAVSSPPDGS